MLWCTAQCLRGNYCSAQNRPSRWPRISLVRRYHGRRQRDDKIELRGIFGVLELAARLFLRRPLWVKSGNAGRLARRSALCHEQTLARHEPGGGDWASCCVLRGGNQNSVFAFRNIFLAISSATVRSESGMNGLLLQPGRDEVEGLRSPGSHRVTGWAAISLSSRAASSSRVSPSNTRLLAFRMR